ncbi:MAG: hypothetical protein [Cressdnaviricota sp.]|nr:MAG: hypothetical protein [Cressdnaviricota sp.]
MLGGRRLLINTLHHYPNSKKNKNQRLWGNYTRICPKVLVYYPPLLDNGQICSNVLKMIKPKWGSILPPTFDHNRRMIKVEKKFL